MAITLAKAKVGMANKVYANLIDEFEHNSILLQKLTFDNSVAAGGSGSTLTYGYVRVKTPATAEGRAINSEYTGSEAEKEAATTELKVLGQKYSIDRVIAQSGGAGFMDEVAFQSEEAVKATVDRFGYLFVKGNASSDAKQFDGIEKIGLAGGRQAGYYVNGYNSALTATSAEGICEALDDIISQCFRKPDLFLMNTKTINKCLAAARMTGYITHSEDAFGKAVDGYNGVMFVDIKKYGATDVIADGEVYAVCLGLDAVHGASPLNNEAFISTRLPNYNDAGAVKDGDVELVTAVVVKNYKAVFKGTISGTAEKTITATLSNATADSGNASTIAIGGYAELKYTAGSGKTLPSSVTVTGASASWNATTGILKIWNPTGNVTFSITAA